MGWSTRYGRAMLAEKRGQNEALGLLVPCVRPELDLRAPRTLNRDIYLPMKVSSLYALFIQNLAVLGHESSILDLTGPTS